MGIGFPAPSGFKVWKKTTKNNCIVGGTRRGYQGRRDPVAFYPVRVKTISTLSFRNT